MSRVLALVIGLSLPTVGGRAQEFGRPGQGFVLAQQLCAQCHALQKDQLSPNAAAPPFHVIAVIPGMTAMALSVALNTSHRSMPNIMIEANDRADIVAYILSLK